MTTPQKITVDKAKLQDAEAIVKIKRDCWLDGYINENYGITELEIKKRFSDDALKQKIKRRRKGIEAEDGVKKQTFVAKIDTKVVGFTAPQIKDERRRIGALYVHPKYHGRGLGGKLLRKSLEWHGDESPVYVYVVKYNRKAQNLYIRHGFKKTGNERQGRTSSIAGEFSPPEIEMIRIQKSK